jgi:ankyrin repeat protein
MTGGINAVSKNERVTGLHLASQNGQLNVVQLLLAAGAESNKPSKTGRTPLSMAAEKGHLEVFLTHVLTTCVFAVMVYPVMTRSHLVVVI